MKYREFIKRVNEMKIDGLTNQEDFRYLVLNTTWAPGYPQKKVEVCFIDPKVMKEVRKYNLEKNRLYVRKGINEREYLGAVVFGICTYALRQQIQSLNVNEIDKDLLHFKTIALKHLVIKTFNLGAKMPIKEHFKFITKRKDFDFEEVLEDIEQAYLEIISYC